MLAATTPAQRQRGAWLSIRRTRDAKNDIGSPNAAAPTRCRVRRWHTLTKSSPYATAERPAASTRASQSISTARRKRHHCHQSARFQGASNTRPKPTASNAGSAARICCSSWANINSRSGTESASAHSGSTTRGAQRPTTAGPVFGETSTLRPSTAASRQRRRHALRRAAATASVSSTTSEAMPHAHLSGVSRSSSEKDRSVDVARTVDDVTVDELCGDSVTTPIGEANVGNASGRSHAAAGSAPEPTRATSHAHRVATPARCRPFSSAYPTTTNARPMPTQYSIQTAITWHLP